MLLTRAKTRLSEKTITVIISPIMTAVFFAIIWETNLVNWLLSIHIPISWFAIASMSTWLGLFLYGYYSIQNELGRLRYDIAQILERTTKASTTAKDAWDWVKEIQGDFDLIKLPNGGFKSIKPKCPNIKTLNYALEDLRNELREHDIPVNKWEPDDKE